MKISFCTTCMDRLVHLEATYIKSISNTSSYKNKEFILLNYGSKKDNVDLWVENNLQEFINSNLVKYYKTIEPEYWFAAHAKNICYKMATGDVIVNLDCDNILVEGYCEYLEDVFNRVDIIVASDSADINGSNGSCGMISSRREHFYNVNGYDESFDIGWGMDDTNYQYRCRMQNNLELIIQDRKYNLCIDHSNEVRTQNCKSKNILETRKHSESILHRVAFEKNYVANKFNEWGKAKLIFNFNHQIEI